MTETRTFEYDEKTKLLTVKAIIENKIPMDSVKNIVSDLKAKQKQAAETIKRFESMDFALKKMAAEPRTKELVEIILTFMENTQIPSKENIDKTLKYWKEQLQKIEDDLKSLEPFSKL